MPPLPRAPMAIKDLAVDQEGADAVLTFTYPDRLLTGLPLTDLEAVEVYRFLNPPSALTAPPPAASSSAGTPRTDEAPIPGQRRAALNARLAEEAFYKDAKRVDRLTLAAIAHATHGAQLVYRDALMPLLAQGKAPASIAYAVVSVRQSGQRSPLSNLAVLAPDIPPDRPTISGLTAEEGRICLEWLEPENDLLNRPVKLGGFFVYRRFLDEDEYGAPRNAKEITGTSFVDVAPPYGKLVYTVRATLQGKPKILGSPAVEAGVDYRDVFPPPAPRRLDALSEGKLVRLVWDPVAATDLAGYRVYRAEGSGSFEPIVKDLIKESFFNDETARPGLRYRYVIKAVDSAGNESAPSPEATAEPF
jgi:hypothetical protein